MVFASSHGRCLHFLRHGDHLGGIAHHLGLVADAFHEQAELLRDLSQHLFRKIASFDSIVELDELDDVATGLATGIVPQKLVVRIKLLHQVEFFAAPDSHDDNRGWQRGGLHDELFDF